MHAFRQLSQGRFVDMWWILSRSLTHESPNIFSVYIQPDSPTTLSILEMLILNIRNRYLLPCHPLLHTGIPIFGVADGFNDRLEHIRYGYLVQVNLSAGSEIVG